MSKHTPAPWSAFVSRKSKTIAVCIGDDANGRRPCIVDWPGFDSCDLPISQKVANARLIAAAPELLQALQMAREQLALEGYQAGGPTFEEIDAALYKATGEQP